MNDCCVYVFSLVLSCDISELQFSQTHSRGQVENLSAQLIQRARQLEVTEGEKRQLQTRVKKLEKYRCLLSSSSLFFFLTLLLCLYSSLPPSLSS